jgi:PAS domain S-box-containing protein
LALLDKQYCYLAANKMYTEAFKLTPEQLIGKTVATVFGEEFFNAVIKPNADRCLGGEEISYQDWFDFPAYEQRRYMEINYYPYYNVANEIRGFVVNGRNITERKRAEEALKDSETKYRTLVESANDAIFILDMKGKFLEVNRTAYERLGYSKEEILSMFVSELELPEFAERVPERLEQVEKHGYAVFESAHVRKDGTAMPVEVNSRIIDYKDGKAYLSIIRDITERKQAEDTIAENKKILATIFEAAPT